MAVWHRAQSVIALLDIDGTLLAGPPEAHAHALCAALDEVYGVRIGVAALRGSGVAGRTDRAIARRVLTAHGFPAAHVDARLERWCRVTVDCYRTIADSHPDPVAVPDAAAALERLVAAGVAIALVTGNIREIAHDKLARAGLGDWFAGDGGGGFGDEACERADVVRLAVRRASVAAADAVVVGDTPHDVAAARAAGCGVVAVTTGPFPASALRAADDVVATLTDAAESILAAALSRGRGAARWRDRS